MIQSPFQTIVRFLKCPVCGGSLSVEDGGKSLCCLPVPPCGKRHCFDFSKSGYVNLDVGHAGGGDRKDAVRARTAFLSTGAYEPISEAVNRLLVQYATPGVLIDAGCGEGYYTCRAAASCPSLLTIGFDLSKSAVDLAAKSAREKQANASFAVAGIFGLPVKDESASAVMNLFAPCAEEEFLRVLKPGGVLILVGAGKRHLMGLKSAVYETPYQNEERADLPRKMDCLTTESLTYLLTLDSGEEIRALFDMTPYRFRTSEADLQKLLSLTHLKTEIDVKLSVYRKPERKD